jgi:transcriptional/translational regulatory protein YebC/TACO1
MEQHQTQKGAADAQRGAIFTKIGREIQVAVRSGGPDPDVNSRLKDVIAKAKSANMPSDNIQRSIKKAAGASESDNLRKSLRGIRSGRCRGDGPHPHRQPQPHRRRCASPVRPLRRKHGNDRLRFFQFQEKGNILIEKDDELDEEQVMMDALEAGAEDFAEEDEVFVITTTPETYYDVRSALETKGYELADSSLGPVPVTWVEVEDPEAVVKLEKMIDALDSHDDVQDVYHNWDN